MRKRKSKIKTTKTTKRKRKKENQRINDYHSKHFEVLFEILALYKQLLNYCLPKFRNKIIY